MISCWNGLSSYSKILGRVRKSKFQLVLVHYIPGVSNVVKARICILALISWKSTERELTLFYNDFFLRDNVYGKIIFFFAVLSYGMYQHFHEC